MRGVHVFGVSFDSAEKNRAFAEKQNFPYPLLCDTERKLGIAYGAAADDATKFAARYTFLISPDGLIEMAIDTKDPGGQAAEILAALG